MNKNGQKPLLPIPIIDNSWENKYLFVQFKEPVRELEMENGQAISVEKGDFLFVPFKTIKNLISQEICHAV